MDEFSNPNTKQPVLCEECKLNPSKYKCPGCSTRSCSLPCVKAHKQRTECTGKRQWTQFVPLSQFDDNVLLSDYNMLEDVKRLADSAQRRRLKLCGYSYFKRPFPLNSLRKAAASRRTKLLFLPHGMSKREANQSNYNNRNKFIFWSIEWRFHSTDIVLIDHRVHERTSLWSVVENHLKQCPLNHQLKQFCKEPPDSLKFLIRTNPRGPKSVFRLLDRKASIGQQLADLVILEYPVIHVFLPSHPCNFEVIKDVIPHETQIKHSITSNHHQSTKGVTFREEEIEDDTCTNPQVLDLMKCVVPSVVEEEYHEKLHTPLLESKTLDNSLLETKNPGMDFDFEQGLIDAYSDLIALTNPDDFLDWECMFSEKLGPDEREDDPYLIRSIIPVEDEELEEGEIPGE